ncbi:MAG TPA: MOSC domain-containing protein, partial [Trinickia sp.]|nr:MOSC domain-containing protein [Trinickia sp.]
KQPRLGPVRVEMNGIQDDKRVSCAADPNRAVFFYQSAYYDLWRAELKRDIPYGTLGENIASMAPKTRSSSWATCSSLGRRGCRSRILGFLVAACRRA